MRISGTEPSSVILSFEKWCPNVPQQAKAKGIAQETPKITI